MKHGSLFSGIGGFDLAAEWMGWENVFHCEWNEFGQKVLKHYWPKAISYEDITKTDFTIHRGNIDILTGGFPCQPYSAAGKRLGKEDERHLWPQMLRAIREIKPRWVVGENVYGLVNWSGGLVFHEVQADLEAEGYEVQPYLLPAVSVNAPHRRDRIWFVAHSKSARTRSHIGGIRGVSERCDKWEEKNELAKNTNNNGWGSKQREEESCEREQRNISSGNNEWISTHNDEIRSSSNANNTRTNIGMPSERERQESNGIGGLTQPELGQTGRDGSITNSNDNGLQQQRRYECSCQNDERGISQSQWSADSENFDNGHTRRYLEGEPSINREIGSKGYTKEGEPSDSRGVRGMDKKCDKCQGFIKEYRDTINKSGTLVQKRQSGVQLPINSRMGDNQTTIEPDKRDGHQNDYNNIKAMDGDVTNTNSNGQHISNSQHEINSSEGRVNAQRDSQQSNGDGDVADTMQVRLQQCEDGREMGGGQSEICGAGSESTNAIETNGEIRDAADTNGIGLRRQGDGIGNAGFIGKNSQRSDWSNFPTVSPIRTGNDGIPDRLDSITFSKWRNESIKAGGNAVVPQVVYQIFKTIEQYEILNNVHNPAH